MNNKNEMMQVFNHEQFGEIRTMTDESGEWFVARDVSKTLGYSKGSNPETKHVDARDKKTYGVLETGQVRNMTLINESGLYDLIFNSRLKSAKEFKRWVTSEVLPSIRKTGTYSTPTQIPTDMASLMQMSQQNANLISATVGVMNQELTKMSGKLENIDSKISTWEDKTDNERNNRRISYAQTTVDFPDKVKQMVYMTSGAEVNGKARIYQNAKKYLLNTLLDVNRANDITLGQWDYIDELIANNRDDWYASYLRKLERERIKRMKNKEESA